MTQEEKQLLIKDLSARLPYRVKINIYDDYSGMMKDEELNVFYLDSTYNIEYKKLRPYLRPIHKLTKEELEELEFHTDSDYVDYCNEHHIDYRNLIPKGLALEAPDGMYKTE